MDVARVGKAIAYLRQRAGYTQKELAERIGISDKAVSKWERGISLPDVAYLGKLAILLDTDSDSLLSGDVIHHDRGWRGVLVLYDNPCGISAETIIYDKPLVYFLLGYFLLVGINRILVFCPQKDEAFLRSEFGSGERLGIRLTYGGVFSETELEAAEVLDDCDNVMVVHGRSIIYGVDQTRFFQRAMTYKDRITVLSIPKAARGQEDLIYFNESRRIVSKEENRLKTQYKYATLPVFFAPRAQLWEAFREVGSYSTAGEPHYGSTLHTEMLDRGFIELSLDHWDDVAEAAYFLKIVQKACGMNIYCLEEIAWRRGMISSGMLRKIGEEKSNTAYGQYILSLGG